MPVAWNLEQISAALQKPVEDLTVIVLDRPRHAELIAEIRSAGARIRLISDGDVAAAIATARPDSGVDVLMGIGGCAEGVIAAAALKCMGGAIQGRLWPRHEEDRAAIQAADLDPAQVLTTSQLCGGDEVFFAATGVSDGDLLKGVRFTASGATTNSMVMRHRSGTIREARAAARWPCAAWRPRRHRLTRRVRADHDAAPLDATAGRSARARGWRAASARARHRTLMRRPRTRLASCTRQPRRAEAPALRRMYIRRSHASTPLMLRRQWRVSRQPHHAACVSVAHRRRWWRRSPEQECVGPASGCPRRKALRRRQPNRTQQRVRGQLKRLGSGARVQLPWPQHGLPVRVTAFFSDPC
jgi:hypothetical protein